MASKYKTTMETMIPLQYRCTKCGAENVAWIPVTRTVSFSMPTLASRDKLLNIWENAYRKVGEAVQEGVCDTYKDAPIFHKAVISHKPCRSCGYKERWVKGGAQRFFERALCVVLPVVVVGGILYLLYISNILDLLHINNIFGLLLSLLAVIAGTYLCREAVRRIDMKRALKAKREIPEECHPRYILPVEAVVIQVDVEVETKIAKLKSR